MIEIIVITYNRAEKLRATLAAIVPYRDEFSRIMVLDNGSTDETPTVCQTFTPQITYRKNRYNIGLEANLLRAWELAEADYLWVLCDDDAYDNWDRGLAEIKQVIRRQSPDLILVAAIHDSQPQIGASGVGPLEGLAQTYGFFAALSFIPAIIIKTQTFADADFFHGYKNIFNFYSYLAFYGRLLNEGATAYVTQSPLVRRPANSEASFPMFDVAVGWMIMNRFLPRKFHDLSMYAVIGPETPLRSLLVCLLRQRLDWRQSTWQGHLRGLAMVPGHHRWLLGLLLPFSFLPTFVYRMVRWGYGRYKTVRGIHRNKTPVNADDPFRT
jgi:glycosyltransferase involved in cell wall biosynthesis